MNVHGSIDDLTVRLAGALLGDERFFRDSLESPPLVDAAADAAVDGMEFDGAARAVTGAATIQTVDAQTPTGEYQAWYRFEEWKGVGHPTVIFHHGSGEDPFASGMFGGTSVDRLFGDGEELRANVVVVRAPFHDRTAGEYVRRMGDLADFVGLLASSTAVIEALVARLHEMGTPAVVVSGISLGGWVTNLHRAVHGTAERYAPIFAGARLGEVFTSSAYRHMTAPNARESPDRLEAVLDFDGAFDRADAQVKGLLARHDRIVEYAVQKDAYAPDELVTMNYGHVTGSLSSEWHRVHLEKALREAPGYEG
ncbi:hypothetical protein HSRCO_0450 [Halanaeroarchaeum sp. HSR-CO]|uniref:hypothetical protein n=1 Tax=Halanaeroarchaeum sp. HSR-CO TaxID=2866382 RepID=UPI00217DB241|nr:hypothetical protein [Halanaeroarchaeum sp. HSR-CO]UWG46747.1 hypothetical protein HSRCO_0450 [Halanaeroarchaeum sp. HSR-CO]